MSSESPATALIQSLQSLYDQGSHFLNVEDILIEEPQAEELNAAPREEIKAPQSTPPQPLEPPISEPQPSSIMTSSATITTPPAASEKQPAATLDALYQEYCNCMNCPLGETRNSFVFASGNPKAKVMFIGEGPGADEDEQGLPFVGRAGKLLTRMIQSIGISRDDVYIANTVKCRPPGNRNPLPDEMLKCRPILEQQIKLVNPQILVTLGNVPLKALIKDAPGITRAHGQSFQYLNKELFATFHPAYLLRNPPAMEPAWDDFKKLQSKLEIA